MMTALDDLKRAAEQAERAEDDFRRDVTQRTRALERDRVFAYRRLNVMRAIAEVIAAAETEEGAVAAARAALRDRLGWAIDDDRRIDVLENFAPVSQAFFASLDRPDEKAPPPDPLRALAGFEAWYASTHPHAFWELFEHYLPETPRVDF